MGNDRNFNPASSAARLQREIEIFLFFWSQQRQHDVYASAPPVAHFVFQPIAATRTGGHRQLALPWSVDPVEFGGHYNFTRDRIS